MLNEERESRMKGCWGKRGKYSGAVWVAVIGVFIFGADVRASVPTMEEFISAIIFPKVEFQDMPLREVLGVLRRGSVELNVREPDPTKKGVNMVLYTGVGENKLGDTPITLKMENAPLGKVLERVAALSKMKYVIEPHAVLIVPREWKAPGKIGGEEFVATRSMIIPSFEFQNTPLSEALAFLQKKSVQLDLMEEDPTKKGVKIVISPAAGRSAKDIKISLKLQNVPLAIALRYTAMQAGMQCKYESGIVRMVPIADKKE